MPRKRDVVIPHGQTAGQMAAVKDWLKVSLINGGAAGNHTLTGIAPGDEIISVIHVPAAGAAEVDFTSEFSISAANQINNTGGTTSAGGQLRITWADLTR